MSQIAGTEAFSIVYDGYEITDSYPSSGDDILMAMDATSGKLLMVTKFNVTNISSQTEHLNMFSKQGKFKLSFNGQSYKSQYTLLLNDLSMYKGDLDAGESTEGVLVFEIPESEAAKAEDMVLTISVDGKSSSMQLKGGSGSIWTEQAEDVEEVEGDLEDVMPEEVVIIEEEVQGSESNDLAQEYMDALEAMEAENSSTGNVTVVGSNRN